MISVNQFSTLGCYGTYLSGTTADLVHDHHTAPVLLIGALESYTSFSAKLLHHCLGVLLDAVDKVRERGAPVVRHKPSVFSAEINGRVCLRQSHHE